MRISDWSSDVCSSDLDPYAAHIAEAPHRFGVPVAWIRAVMRVESAGRVLTISSAGAMGLMQVMPGTWAELRTRYGLGGDPYDADRTNVVKGKRVSVRVDLGGGRDPKKKKTKHT